MATDIGPRIGIDGEAQFRKQLNNINTEIKTLGTELKKVSSQFKDNAESEQALISKNQVLQKSIDAQSKKLQEANKALTQASEKYGETSNEALRWQQVVNRTETSLNDLQSELRQNEKALQEIKDGFRDAETGAKKMDAAIDSVDSTKLEQVSKAADGLADKFVGISKAAGALGAAILGTVPATQEYRRDLSFLEQNARQAGVGMNSAEKAFKTFNAVSGETDSSIEGVSNLLQAGFTKSNLQKVVEGLAGAATRFPDTLKIEGLADGLQETLATGKAIGPFAELLDRVGIGADNFSEDLAKCTTEAEKQNLVLETLAKAGLTDSYEAWKKNNKELVDYENAMLEMKNALSDLAVSVSPLVTAVAGVATDLLQKFNNLPEPVKKVAGVLIALAAAAAPTLGIIGKMGEAFGTLSTIGAAIGPKLAGVGAALAGMAGPILAVVAAVAALIAIFATLWKTNEDFRTKIKDLWDQIREIFTNILGQIQGIFSSFIELVNAAWAKWGDEIMAVVNVIISTIVPIITNGLNVIQNVIKFVTALINGDWKTAWKSAGDVVKSAATLIKSIVTASFSAIAGIIRSVGGSIAGAVKDAFQSGINYITSLPAKARQWGRDFMDGLISGIQQKINSIINTISGVAGTIRSYLHFSRPDVGPLREYEKWMPDFIDGLAKGIEQNMPKIEKAASNLAGKLYEANPLDKIAVTAGVQMNSEINYERLAALMSQGIYLDGRQVGRALREAGVITG